MSKADFNLKLKQHARAVEDCLKNLLDDIIRPGEIARPDKLLAAMRYSVLNGGKRLRPFLVIECAALFGVEPHHAMRTAAALECIHSYSLVHDDLPAMDDDELRRGKETTHIAFDEATAILAGDGLLTFAFDILAAPATDDDAAVRCRLVLELARAAGLGGMVGGQNLDLESEKTILPEEQIKTLQDRKSVV